MTGAGFFYITVALCCMFFVPVAWLKRKKQIARQEKEIWSQQEEEKLQAENAVLLEKKARMIKTNRMYVNYEDSLLLQSNPRITVPGGRYPGHTVIYTATFLTDTGHRAQYQIPFEIFTALEEGQKGVLATLNDAFLDFDTAEEKQA